jgi:MFS family permease
MSAALTRYRQRLCLGYERGPQYRWERVPDAHDYVDNVSHHCGILLRRMRTDGKRSGYVISQIPSQLICTRGKAALSIWEKSVCNAIGILIYDIVRLSLWCPSWELFWVIVTFATASVKTTHQLYACRFLVGLAEGTFYPAVHTVLGGWYTKQGDRK